MKSVSTFLAGLALILVASFGVGCKEAGPETATSAEEFAARRDAIKLALGERASGQRANKNRSTESNQANGSMSVAPANFVYSQNGMRDPFRSFQFDLIEAPGTLIGPLADYELSQLAVVAVIWDTDRARALIADPGGRAFSLEEGSRIGKNQGRVVAITDNLVRVRETYIDFEGYRSSKDVEMLLRRNQGG